MKETLRHREVFEYYYSLGEKRGLRKVGQKCDVSRSAVGKWSKAFNWQERVEQRDIENAKKLEAEVNKAVVSSKADYRALIKKVVKEFEDRLEAGKIRIAKPEDLSIMAKLDLLMMGEATEKEKQEITIISAVPRPKDEEEE